MSSEHEQVMNRNEIIFKIGGEEHTCRVLSCLKAEEWRKLVKEKEDNLPTSDPDFVWKKQADILELVLAYTKFDKYWLLEEATDREIMDVYTKLMDLSFPFMRPGWVQR